MLVVKVDVEPLTSRFAGLLDSQLDHAASDALTPMLWRHDHVLEPSMHPTIPDDVDEADQPTGRRGRGDPTETVAVQLPSPIVIEYGVVKGLRMKQVELGIVDIAAPQKLDAVHTKTVPDLPVLDTEVTSLCMEEHYTHGHFGTVIDSHAERTAANSAAFLLPHLQSTDAVLDVGCGPGSITLDLAEWVGTIIGVDAAPEAIIRSEEENSRRGVDNAAFQVSSAYELPFDEASFDIVYAHQLLQHLAEPVAALSEARRVLKPGGILAVRDADYGTMVHDPQEPAIDRWLELYQELARSNGGEPNAGRMLARWVGDAGFVDITSSTSTWTYTTPAAVESWRLLWTTRLLEARMGKDMVAKAIATGDQLAELAAGWDRWAAAPLPFFAFLHGEVLARKKG